MKSALAIAFILSWGRFSTDRVVKDRAHESRWDVRAVSETERSDIRMILDQPFIYGSEGAQAYVFFSQDGRYVLKLLKRKRYELPIWYHGVPGAIFHQKVKKLASKEANREKDYSSYQIAFNQLQDETALVFVHLNQRDSFHQKVSLVYQQRSESIDLDHYDYILQRRAVAAYSAIEQFMASGEREKAQLALKSLAELLKRIRSKGVIDREPNIEKNFGFIGTEAVQIDIGRFQVGVGDPPTIRPEFREWLRQRSLSDEFFS